MKTLNLAFLALMTASATFAMDQVVAVPEAGLDATTIASAIGLLGGTVLILRGRRRK
jgi:hypothetical protein